MDVDITKMSTEAIKCPNAPQKPNKYSKGFKCCHHHVKKLLEKGLNLMQIDKYIEWTWYKKELKRNTEKLNSNKIDNQNNKEKIQQKIIDINKILKNKNNFSKQDENTFEQVSRYGIVKRKSQRIKSNKQKANLNEMLIMEEDEEFLHKLEQWLNDTVHPDMIQFKKRMYIFTYILLQYIYI